MLETIFYYEMDTIKLVNQKKVKNCKYIKDKETFLKKKRKR